MRNLIKSSGYSIVAISLSVLFGCSSNPKYDARPEHHINNAQLLQTASKPEVNHMIHKAISSHQLGDWRTSVYEIQIILEKYYTEDSSLEIDLLTAMALIQIENEDYAGANVSANRLMVLDQKDVYLPRNSQIVIYSAQLRQGLKLMVKSRGADQALFKYFQSLK